MNSRSSQRTLRATAERNGAEPVIGEFLHPLDAAVIVVTFLAAALLAAAGAVKLVRPQPAASALSAAGLPGGEGAGRALGAVEVAIGSWALIGPSTISDAAVAVAYLAFAAFVGFLLVARPHAPSCGCAGAKDVPPSWLHLLLNLIAAAAGAVGAISPSLGIGRVAESLGWAQLPFVSGMAAAGALAVVAVTDLPRAYASYRRPAHHPIEPDRDRHARADAALFAAGIGAGHASLWPSNEPPEDDGD